MQWRLPLNFGRERNLQNRTAVSAVLPPPLHETARYRLVIFSFNCLCHIIVFISIDSMLTENELFISVSFLWFCSNKIRQHKTIDKVIINVIKSDINDDSRVMNERIAIDTGLGIIEADISIEYA